MMKLKTFIIAGATSLLVAGTTLGLVGITDSSAKDQKGTKVSNFENLINVTGVPDSYGDSQYESTIAPFSDLGSWHALSLPGYNDREFWGGFTQPLIVEKTAPRSIAKSLDELEVYEVSLDSFGNPISNDGILEKKLLNFRNTPIQDVHIKQYPGGLWQEFVMADITLQVDLRYTHSKTSTVKYNIINNSSAKRGFQFAWHGKLFDGAVSSLGASFESEATLDSHPVKWNEYGQGYFESSKTTKEPSYYHGDVEIDINDASYKTVKDNLNHASKFRDNNGTFGGSYSYIFTPRKTEEDAAKTTASTKPYATEKFEALSQQELDANKLKNVVSIKFGAGHAHGDNWLGHDDDWRWQMAFPSDHPVDINADGDHYRASMKTPMIVNGNSSNHLSVSTTFSFTSQERKGGWKYEKHTDDENPIQEGTWTDYVSKEMSNSKLLDESFVKSGERWKYYIDNLIGDDSKSTFDYQKVAVKGMESLITNWRGSSGMIEHQGITPSLSIQWFNSFWSWDSWKQASAAVHFDPKLAMDNVKVLYDYQVKDDPKEDFYYHYDAIRRHNDVGMIPDLVDYQESNTNWRDTKPPLSAWSVWNIYDTVKKEMWNKEDIRTGKMIKDEVKEFLKYMYIRLMAYHAWWYQNRDADGNGVNEYGGTLNQTTEPGWQSNSSRDSIVESSAWESGMDNAPRFDANGSGADDPGLEFTANRNADGSVSGWVLQQESVDLNSYMYAEKQYIAKIADALKQMGVPYNALAGVDPSSVLHKTLFEPMLNGIHTRLKGEAKSLGIMSDIGKSYDQDIAQMYKDSTYLKNYINDKMYDNESGFFYDLRYEVDDQGTRTSSHLLTNRGKGPEGFIPLWAGASTASHADAVRDNIMDTHGFNTKMPFPTASWDNEKFEPDQYWRGPVWLDQAYFGVQGLRRNGAAGDASYMVQKLFNNAEGLMTGQPIRENYNPITGEGLSSKGFSWSSGMYLLMYENYIKNGGSDD